MNIFLFELRRQRTAIIAWTIALSVICLFFMCLYPAFNQGMMSMKDMLANYPKQVLDALNMHLDNMGTIFGYYPFALTYVALIGSIGAVYFGMGMLSRENREKTADFLLSKPVKRGRVIAAKMLAVLCSLVIINAVFVVTSIFWCLGFSTSSFNVGTLVMMSATLFFMQLVFAAFGVFIAVFFRRIKSVLSVALAVGFAFFLLSAFDSIVNDAADKISGQSGLDVMHFISPTKYFDYQAIAINNSYSAAPFVTVAVVLVLFVGASAVWFVRQDTHAV